MTTPPLDSSLDLDKLTRRHETFRMPILELRRLTKRFGDFAAVDDLSLDIAAGEFLTLLGASGSGKTTTLRMIAGFEPPTSGEILMAGTPIAALPAVQARHQHRLPALRAVPAHERARQHRLRPPDAPGARRPSARSG